jgi:hypothetical protein
MEEDSRTLEEVNIIAAAVEWSEARTSVLKSGGSVTPQQYDRLARAEANLQKAVHEW